MSENPTTNATLTTLRKARPPALPEPADVIAILVERRRAAAA